MTGKKNLDHVTVKGLSGFAKDFLFAGNAEEIAMVDGTDEKKKNEKLAQWVEYRMKEFIDRAGNLTEDTLAYYTELMHKRGYDNTEGIFAVALLAINLRNSYGHEPRTLEESKTGVAPATAEERLAEFDKICVFAQSYYDNNQEEDS